MKKEIMLLASLGAPIDEVWSGDGGEGSFLRRAAPGSRSQSKKRPEGGAKAPRVSRHKQQQQRPGDPLCDLYVKGYSQSITDTMSQRSPYLLRGSEEDDYYARQFRRSGEDGNDKPNPNRRVATVQDSADSEYDFMPMQPIDLPEAFGDCDGSAADAVADSRRRAAYGPIDFYDGGGDDADDGGGGEGMVERYSNNSDSAPMPVPPPPDSRGGAPSASRGSTNRETSKELPAAGGVSGVAFAMDMSLYIVSGVIMIFLMEQFIQVGVRIRT